MALIIKKVVAADITGAAVPTVPATKKNIASGMSGKTPAKRKSYSGHSKALPIDFALDHPGHVRVGHWLTALKWSHSKFYAESRKKNVAPPDGRDPRPWWHTATLLKKINETD